MSDDLGLFADDPDDDDPPRRGRDPEFFRRRKRRRWVTAIAGVCVFVLVVGGALYGVSQIRELRSYEDYDGGGHGDVVIEVASGDTISAIGSTMTEKGVVASSRAFVEAAEENRQINSIQPGYYLMRREMSGQAAVEHIVSDKAQVGRVEVRGGMRLEDQLSPDGGRKPGVLTRLAQASCAGGAQQCVTSEQMHQAAASADLAELGVPEWLRADAAKGEGFRRLEGLILPGVYDVKPGADAVGVLRSVLRTSAAKLEAAGVPQAAEQTGRSPYELLTVASLVQSESIEKDFGKVARVVYNRLEPPQMHLGMDSTINYPLDKPSLLTKPEDRNRPGPYNTYQTYGLPPTPISAPSQEAILAAEKPAEGDWKYFVKCYPDGTSCFAETQEEHDRYIQQAQKRGAF
ncbi:hypothetical protein GCM10027174_30460 [Salinifilum aidingensis]